MKLPSSRRTVSSAALAAALALVALVGSGCGSGDGPLEAQLQEKTAETTVLGFPALATKNTTRVAGKDAVADAAAVAQAVFPSQARSQRPRAVTLVDQENWQAGVAASVLMAPPLAAPPLLTDGGSIPAATNQALDTLGPIGFKKLRGLQAFAIGGAGAPDNLKVQRIPGTDPYTVAAAIDGLRQAVAGRASANIVVASGEQAAFAMPAAAYAAKSGDSVLLTSKNTLPPATRAAIKRRKQPSIYLLGPQSVISSSVEKKLKRLGSVSRVSGLTPASNAVAFARYSDGSFGWGIKDPGHGLTIANTDRPLDAAAAAPLGASGDYAPLLLTDSPSVLPASLRNYLLDIQPGYRFDPTRGVYNHAWILGDETAIDLGMQADIDRMTEIVKIKQINTETAPTP